MKKHIVVLGGGFGGAETVFRFKNLGYKVTLISNREYVFIYPISIWIPVNKLKFKDAQISLKELQKANDFDLIIDEVTAIKSKTNKVILTNGEVEYDYLVVALGSGKVKLKGLEHSFSICGQPEQAILMRDRFNELLKQGYGKIAFGFGGNPKDKSSVRGGPAFELIFNFIHTLKQKKLYDKFEITFFAPMKEPGKKLGIKGFEMLQKQFKKENVQIRIGKKIIEFQSDKVIFEDNTILESDLIMYIPAGAGHPVMQNSDLPLSDAGFIKIDYNSKVDGLDNVYAVGDIVALQGPEWAAKQGHIAEVMANNAVQNIHNVITGNPERHSYKAHLSIICVMDTGDGAIYTSRTDQKIKFLPMPVVGHWMKKAWGTYWKKSKLRQIPRVPGM